MRDRKIKHGKWKAPVGGGGQMKKVKRVNMVDVLSIHV
jgi:hypothetical protein